MVKTYHGSDDGNLADITGVFPRLQSFPARTRVTLVCMGVAGVLFAWWLSTLSLLIALDWDNAFHLWQIERMLTRGDNHCGLGGTLWTCGYTAHMALEPLYGAFASVARSWGGDTLDGLRAVNALAVAAAALCLTVVIRRTRATIWATILVVLAWLATADVLFLIRTVEDDCLSLAWMAGLLCCCTLPPSRWSPVTAMIWGDSVERARLSRHVSNENSYSRCYI